MFFYMFFYYYNFTPCTYMYMRMYMRMYMFFSPLAALCQWPLRWASATLQLYGGPQFTRDHALTAGTAFHATSHA